MPYNWQRGGTTETLWLMPVFQGGLNQTAEEIAASLERDTDGTHRRLLIEKDKIPVGEMHYRNKGGGTAEIGIKICDFSLHDKGLGKILLSMLLSSLFRDMGYEKIILDTNVENKRAQHVYARLGFRKIRIRENSWKNQLGEFQSSVEYELYPENFVSFANEF